MEGKAHGQGTATLSTPGVGEARYDGEWSAGSASGEGTWDRPDGSRYKGAFLDGQRHGEGKWTWTNPDGGGECRLDGYWRNNEFWSGGGAVIKSSGRYSGSLFTGAWQQGVFWWGFECTPTATFHYRNCIQVSFSHSDGCPGLEPSFSWPLPASCGTLSHSFEVCH